MQHSVLDFGQDLLQNAAAPCYEVMLRLLRVPRVELVTPQLVTWRGRPPAAAMSGTNYPVAKQFGLGDEPPEPPTAATQGMYHGPIGGLGLR